MHMGKIEAAEAVLPVDDAFPARPGGGSLLIGILILAVALPLLALRLVGGALWRDVVRLGRFARLVGSTYAEGFSGK